MVQQVLFLFQIAEADALCCKQDFWLAPAEAGSMQESCRVLHSSPQRTEILKDMKESSRSSLATLLACGKQQDILVLLPPALSGEQGNEEPLLTVFSSRGKAIPGAPLAWEGFNILKQEGAKKSKDWHAGDGREVKGCRPNAGNGQKREQRSSKELPWLGQKSPSVITMGEQAKYMVLVTEQADCRNRDSKTRLPHNPAAV